MAVASRHELQRRRRARLLQPEDRRRYREEHFAAAFAAAREAAGISDYVRPFHDLRHTAITNDAASGASPIAVMSKAGHASMGTTKRYLHLAGVVFRHEAAALEQRLGLSTEPSTDLTSSERIEENENRLNKRH